jgi:hypothetical protein
VLPRSVAIIQSCCRIQRTSGINRVSDYPRDAPDQQLRLISAAPAEQSASSTSTSRRCILLSRLVPPSAVSLLPYEGPTPATFPA